MKASSVLEEIQAQYIVDEQGKKTGIILKIETFKKLIEELEDLHLGAMAKTALNAGEESHDLEEVKKEILKKK